MYCIRLISRYGSKNLHPKYMIDVKILQPIKCHFRFCTSALNKEHDINEDEDLLKKIIYNEILQKKNPEVKTDEGIPACLKYLLKENEVERPPGDEKIEEKENVHLPYEATYKFSQQINENEKSVESISQKISNFTPSDVENIKVPNWGTEDFKININSLEKPIRWAFEETKWLENYIEILKFGTCDPHKPVSSVPCGGCGALLQCNDATIPGFIPAEIFEVKSKMELQSQLCQRCCFLKQFDVALGVNVSPSEYLQLISKIKEKQALAVIMVDMLDFPCSIFPEIFDLIGPTKPVIIVGNKVDLLIQEDDKFLQHFKQCLMLSLKKKKVNLENIKHVCLISAKTGYGIEELIDVLHNNWGNKGDVYLIGCTNVGKSSLFNALIQSDYCKVQAVNLLQRATVSAWPGTTLNLLKFPILKPIKWRLIARSKRLFAQEQEKEAFNKFQNLNRDVRLEQIPLQDYVGTTFLEKTEKDESDWSNKSSEAIERQGIDYDDNDFVKGKWFYDTPGVVHNDQIVNLLTTSELLLTVPKRMLLPRNFLLKPGNSIFIAGLARLDYTDGLESVWFTVYASMDLPLTVTKTKDADEVYEKLLGSSLFRVPVNGKERLKKWPNLLSKKFEIWGRLSRNMISNNLTSGKKLPKGSDVDIVLSSAGWISVNVPLAYRCNVEAWTPEGRGIYLREIPIIKTGYDFKGPRIPGTPAFICKMKEIKGYSITDKPPSKL